MFWSKTFIPTLKEAPEEAESESHQLMLRAGLVKMLIAGAYTYLPLGLKVLNNINKIIRQEMLACGANELLLPALQPLDLWMKTGRDKTVGDVMIRFIDRRGRNLCLGPTHEEVITDLVRNYISSYKQMPLILYQIQTKFRDEIRPRFGLIRACEFIMKDAYSFDQDEEGLKESYKTMYNGYKRIFERCGLDFLTVEADPGIMGGNVSHEFMVGAESGEDIVWLCSNCRFTKGYKDEQKEFCPECQQSLEKTNTIEVGHIFKLGSKYSSVLGANFLDAKGMLKPITMGCYGIGVSRLICAVVEQNHDTEGIIWPDEISPYQVIILPLDVTDSLIFNKAQEIYTKLNNEAKTVLFDDRNERAGVKFKDADLIGIPLQVIIGKESLRKDVVELKLRRSNEKIVSSVDKILKEIEDRLR